MLFLQRVLEFALFLFVVAHCKGPPVLMKPVKKQYIVKEGKTVKLRCKVSGIMDSVANRTLTAWRKVPERFFITNNLERFRMKLGRYLRITNVTLSDSGTYACIAKNSHGSISRNISLIVRPSSVRTKGTPVKANTRPLASTALNSSTEEPVLKATIKRQPSEGSPRPSQPPIIDDSPPQFIRPSYNRFSVYAEGQPISLKCHAYGEPPFKITWMKDGKMLNRDRQSSFASKGSVLRFHHLLLSDSGTYTCTVRNAFGSIQRTFQIKVIADSGHEILQRKPVILKRDLRNETAKEGDDVMFVCSAVSNSHPEFRWYRWNLSNHVDPLKSLDLKMAKFREIRESAKQYENYEHVYTHRLVVFNVTTDDEAKYTCIVGNSAGYVSEHAFLTVSTKADNEAYNETEADELTEPSRKTAQQSELEILVEDVPLAALIGVPVAVVILLVGTVVWCCFTTRKLQNLQLIKANKNPPQQHKKFDFLSNGETRNASKNVYIDVSNGKPESPRTSHETRPPPCCSSNSNKQQTLDGLVVHIEPTVTHSKHNSGKPVNRQPVEQETRISDL